MSDSVLIFHNLAVPTIVSCTAALGLLVSPSDSIMCVSPALERELGSDLWSLVRSVDTPLAAATPVSGGDYAGYRPNAFRLQFADGRVLKGRRVDTAQQAETVEYVSQCLGHRGLPRVWGRCGRALLTEWVEGEVLAAGPCDPEVLRQCGTLQGFVHSRELPEGSPSPANTMKSWQRTLERRLVELVESGVLENLVARHAVEIARGYAPPHCALGFAFVDFCADNIVQQASGEVCVVDNETLSIEPCDYDLARTWYRWPMKGADREAYFSGYRVHRRLETFLAHFPHWAIAALVDGALFRARRGGVEAAAVPVGRLRALLHDLERGVAAEAAVFLS